MKSSRLKSPSILLFTGKGGVGKTTLAAATALRAADLGHKTLVMSADPAHSLADALNHSLGPEPVKVSPNLHAQEIDVYYSIQKYWGTLREFILQVFRWQKVDDILVEELAALPGMEEGAAFLWVDRFHQQRDFDLLVIDCAPTGEALTLLSLPQVGRWWMERIFPLQRKVAKALGPMVRAVTGMPIPPDATYQEVEDLYQRLLDIHEVLSNPQISSVRLVLNPERMVIQETRRAFTYLQLYGYPVDAAIVNRILPEDASAHVFRKYVREQKRYLREIDEAFEPLPIFRVPHLGEEVFGLSRLRALGKQLYGERDPTEVFLREKPYQLKALNGEYLLQIRMPFLEKPEVSVLQYGDELVVQVHNRRRNLFLPRFLAYYSATEAKLEDGWLKVRFLRRPEGAQRNSRARP